MNREAMWQFFLETGIPEYYLMYRAMKSEASYVPENKGSCAAGDSL